MRTLRASSIEARPARRRDQRAHQFSARARRRPRGRCAAADEPPPARARSRRRRSRSKHDPEARRALRSPRRRAGEALDDRGDRTARRRRPACRRRASSGSSSAPTAAARPPCAQSARRLGAKRRLATATTTGTRRQAQRRHQARRCPPPMMTMRPSSVCRPALTAPASARRRVARARRSRDRWSPRAHRLQRAPDIGERDPLHVRAEIARPHEFDVGMTRRRHCRSSNIRSAARRAAGLLRADICRHLRRRAGEIGFVDDLGRALGMGEHDDAGMVLAQTRRTSARAEALVHLAVRRPMR